MDFFFFFHLILQREGRRINLAIDFQRVCDLITVVYQKSVLMLFMFGVIEKAVSPLAKDIRNH